jgi:methylglutaconyl-CoA hydratase
MENNLILSTTNGVANIVLNRQHIHNALDDELIKHFTSVLKNIESDPAIKVVVLAAKGKSFSAGADFHWMKKMASYTYEQNLEDAKNLSVLMKTLKYLNKPTIAKVQGSAFGGGVGLIACCDISIAAMDAFFALSEVKIGLIPAVISPYVISMIGERAARYYFLTGEKFDAREAARLGLITKVVNPEELEMITQQTIEKIQSLSPATIFAAKTLLNRVTKNPYDDAHEEKNIVAIAEIRVSKEGQEGLNAFLEKRAPVW